MTGKVCRLCLQTIPKNYETIRDSLLKSLNLYLNITKGSVMCTECANHLQVFSNFKAASVYKRDRILSLPDYENDVNSGSDEIKTTNNIKPLMEMEIKCSFCPKIDKRGSFVPLNESKKYESLVIMLKQHIPEMNLNNTEGILTCEPCLEALQGVLRFILKCWEVDKEINRYTKMTGVDAKGQVELKDVQQFICSPALKLETESLDVSELGYECSDKIKKEFTASAKAEIKYEREVIDPELIIKTEAVDIKLEKSDCDSCQESSIKNNGAGDPLNISVTVPETRCEEIVKRHEKLFKCETCSYEAKRKSNLSIHLLTHASPSEITMFKCEICCYETCRKSNLKYHLLAHKSSSEINMFKCEMCPYETYHKGNLKVHLLIHRSPSEVNMIKCEQCSYETYRKGDFKHHLLSHKSPSEINMLKCKTCSYETKHRSSLRNHLLIHKSPSEINMFKCEMCPFETKRKHNLNQHLLTHKNYSEYSLKCEKCSYKAKRKYDLTRHVLTHRSPSEVDKLKCAMCSFVGIHEGHLQRHLLLIHRSPADAN